MSNVVTKTPSMVGGFVVYWTIQVNMKRTPLKRGSKQLKRSGFARKIPQGHKNVTAGTLGGKKRTSGLKRVGEIGKANLKANQIIREMELPQYCEMKLDGCLGQMFLTIAHRHKRSAYKGEATKLSDINQIVVACVDCHDKTEHNRKLNDEVFCRLRGKDNMRG